MGPPPSTIEPTAALSEKRYRPRYGGWAVMFVTAVSHAKMRNVLATLAMYAGP